MPSDIETQYLTRWAVSLRTSARPAPERTARAIASQLLDNGFSPTFLHRWWSYKLRYEAGVRPLADIIDDVHTMALKPAKDYDVLVAFGDFTKRKDAMPDGWLDASAVSHWLKTRAFDVKEIRQKGGILMRVPARDPHAAVESAREQLESMSGRVRVGFIIGVSACYPPLGSTARRKRSAWSMTVVMLTCMRSTERTNYIPKEITAAWMPP